MFGKTPDKNKLLAELKEYISVHWTQGLEKPHLSESSALQPEIRYSLPVQDISPDESSVKQEYIDWEKTNSVRKSFSSEVVRRVDRQFPRPSAFYNPAGIDKRTYHKIKTDYGYQPSRKTALRCCVGLHLDYEEAAELMKLAGFALSPSEPTDLIIRFCLEKKIWDMDTINFLLSSFDLEDLDE